MKFRDQTSVLLSVVFYFFFIMFIWMHNKTKTFIKSLLPFCNVMKYFSKFSVFGSDTAQPDWVYEFPDQTGLDPKIAGQVLPVRTESGLIYRTRPIISRSRFEAALVYKPRILGLKIEEFLFLVHNWSVT